MVVVFGKGGHALAVADCANRLGYNAVAVAVEEIGKFPWHDAVVGVGCSDMAARIHLFDLLKGKRLKSAIHPSRHRYRMIGDGTVIFPGVTLGVGVDIGQNVVVYSGSVVEHGSTIGDHAWLSPGVILCGNVTIKPRAFLGAGAIVLPGVTIGEGAKIGAGAVVHFDIPAGGTIRGPRSTA